MTYASLVAAALLSSVANFAAAQKTCADTDTVTANDQAFTTCDVGWTIKTTLPTTDCADQVAGCQTSDCCDGPPLPAPPCFVSF